MKSEWVQVIPFQAWDVSFSSVIVPAGVDRSPGLGPGERRVRLLDVIVQPGPRLGLRDRDQATHGHHDHPETNRCHPPAKSSHDEGSPRRPVSRDADQVRVRLRPVHDRPAGSSPDDIMRGRRSAIGPAGCSTHLLARPGTCPYARIATTFSCRGASSRAGSDRRDGAVRTPASADSWRRPLPAPRPIWHRRTRRIGPVPRSGEFARSAQDEGVGHGMEFGIGRLDEAEPIQISARERRVPGVSGRLPPRRPHRGPDWRRPRRRRSRA